MRFLYRTTYEYVPPVRDGTTALRLRPAPRAGLSVLESSLVARPGHTSATYIDGWGTAVDVVECPGSHANIAFEMKALVETFAGEAPAELLPAESIGTPRRVRA